MGQRQGAQQAQETRFSEAELAVSQRAIDLAQLSADAKRTLEAMTRKLAEIQARVTRLDALGSHLTTLSGFDLGEFDFSSSPGAWRSSRFDLDRYALARAVRRGACPAVVYAA